MSKPDGGPAFDEGGVSVRDFFAAFAVVGELATFARKGMFQTFMDEADRRGYTASVALSKAAYEIADAMLAEREKRKHDTA